MAKIRKGQQRRKSLRRRKFEKNFIDNGGNARRAALDAGYPVSTANRKSHEMAHELTNSIRPVLRAAGLDESYIAAKIKEAGEATTVKWNRAEEEWDKFADNGTRLHGAELLAELLGHREREAGDQRPVQIIFPNSFANLTVAPGGGNG